MQNRYPCCDIGHTHAQHVKISQMMKGESQVENKQEPRSLNAGEGGEELLERERFPPVWEGTS